MLRRRKNVTKNVRPHLSRVYIISVWNSSTVFGGIHTVAFTSDKDKNIVVYNRYSNVSTPYIYYSNDGKTGLDLFLEENGDPIVMYEVIKE